MKKKTVIATVARMRKATNSDKVSRMEWALGQVQIGLNGMEEMEKKVEGFEPDSQSFLIATPDELKRQGVKAREAVLALKKALADGQVALKAKEWTV